MPWLVNRFSETADRFRGQGLPRDRASVADLAELKPDTLIVATGSVPVIPRFCEGIANAVTAEDILTGKAKADSVCSSWAGAWWAAKPPNTSRSRRGRHHP